MYDFYGDGWDGAEVFAEYPNGDVKSDAPNCINRTIYHELCTNQSGLYYFTALHPNASYVPDNYWEIMWTVSNTNCNGKTIKYTGGYNTTMIWDYEDGIWSLVYWENLWDNEKACDPCGDARTCKPKKPKSKNNKKKSAVKKSDTTDTTDDMTSSNSTNTTTGKTAKRYGPPAVNVRVTMFDEEGDGWWQNDYLGASWYLADDERKHLFFTGTLCTWYKGYCNICLGDGAYTIRFTGQSWNNNASNFTAWDFCGVTGGYSMELTFHIKKGKCIPDALTALETSCFGSVNSTVTLSGVLALGGLSTEVFDMADSKVVTRTLARMVDGWSANRMSIVSTTLDTVAFSDSRKLSSFTHDVTFQVQFESEVTYGVDGRDFAKLNDLVDSLSSQLESTISTGSFQIALTNRATLAGVAPLAHIQQVELLSLEIESVSYVGVEELVAGNLPSVYTASEDSTNVTHKFDVTTIVIFFSAMGIGFIAFVGILTSGAREYNSLPMDSTHARETDESLEISRTDMDITISNPLGGNVAMSADTSAVSSTL